MDLLSLLIVLAVILVATLMGSMVFFSAVMAPLIFIKLEIEVAGRFVRAVFPWYYLVVIVLAGLGGLSLLAVLPLNGGLLLLVAVSAIYCRQSLMPRINAYRDRSLGGEKAADKVFNRLHRLSEVINGLQLLAVIAVLLHLAFFIDAP